MIFGGTDREINGQSQRTASMEEMERRCYDILLDCTSANGLSIIEGKMGIWLSLRSSPG